MPETIPGTITIAENDHLSIEKHFPQGVCFLDLETTGLSPLFDHIIEIAAIKILPGQAPEVFHRLVKPPCKIPLEGQKFHKISDEMVETASSIEDVYPSLAVFLGDYDLIAHNAKFDSGFLALAAQKSELDLPSSSVYDSILLARMAYKPRRCKGERPENHKLSGLADFFNIPFEHHRALADTHTLLLVVARIFATQPETSELLKKSRLFSLKDLQNPKTSTPTQRENIPKITQKKKKLKIRYQGGSKGNQWRPVEGIAWVIMPKDYYLYAKCLLSQRFKYFQLAKIKDISLEGKEIWKEELRDSIRSLPVLKKALAAHKQTYPFLENLLERLPETNAYPLLLPQSYLQQILDRYREHPQTLREVLLQFLPDSDEYCPEVQNHSASDPIGDEKFSVAPQLIHRYGNRALFAPTSVCPIHCRYCFRKNELYPPAAFLKADFEKTLIYLNAHPEIEEIIFTGGDPFVLDDIKLKSYLDAFSKISHLKFIRFHSRMPAILPSRFTETTLEMLSQYKSRFSALSIAVHINHPGELLPSVSEGLQKIGNAGIMLLTQSVLLKGVNNKEEILLDLFHKLSCLGIRPYYLHHPDHAKGAMHFWISLEEGRRIYQKLRNKLPGWAIPQYMIDIPGGEGKSPAYNPEEIHFSGKLFNRFGESRPVRTTS